MASLDITPQELRDIEIREAWRGYHRDDVDELLERAAATIEHLEAELDQVHAGGPRPVAPAAPARPAPRPAPAPAVAPAPASAPIPRGGDADIIQRTMLMAQKAADDAVAEAKARASQIVSESEARAQQLVTEAEDNARKIAEVEKRRFEEEIGRLKVTRDTLTADIAALEVFERDYRERLQRAIESELDLLAKNSGAAPGPAPTPHPIDLPTPITPPSGAPVGDGPSWSASQEGALSAPAPGPADTGPATVHIDAVAAGGDDAWDPAPAGGWSEPATAAVIDDSAELDIPEHGDSLDDDAFFASLREAVRDDAPLRQGSEDETSYHEAAPAEDQRGLFKRRR